MSELAAVEEVPVWLEVNGRPVVTWMCTPDLLEELAIGWLHGEGYIDRVDQVHLRPCATDLGFWAEVPPERVAAVQAEGRRPVLGYHPKLQTDPHFRDQVLFHEYFHGDSGRGVGAAHQTGWTGLIAKLLMPRAVEGPALPESHAERHAPRGAKKGALV